MGFRNPILTATDPTARAAAAAASSTADDALTLAGNKNHVFLSATAPAAPSYGFTVDDLWIDTANGYRLNTWTGAAWAPRSFGAGAIAAAAITADLIAAHAIGAGQLSADAIDGRTITGATMIGGTFRTASMAPGQITPSAGVRLEETTDAQGQPFGILYADDGITNDAPSYLQGKADYNPRSVAATLGGGWVLQAGRYNGVQGPALSLKVETPADGTGGAAPVVRLTTGSAGGQMVTDTPFGPVKSTAASFIAAPFLSGPSSGNEQFTAYQLASGLFFLAGILYNNSAGAVSAAGTQLASIPGDYAPASGVVYLLAHLTTGATVTCELQANGGIYLRAGSIPSAGYLSFHCPYRTDVPKHA